MQCSLMTFLLLTIIVGVAQSTTTGKDGSVILQRLCNQRPPNNTSKGMPQTEFLKNLVNLPKSTQACYPVDETVGTNNGPENALWYFREDLLMNSGHVYWHVSHPQNLLNPQDPLDIDRRGELFHYFHRNVIARYNTERISNGLAPVQPIVYEEGATIEGGYDPHMLDAPHDFRYPPRSDNQKFVNISNSVDLLNLLKADIDNRTLIGKNGTRYNLETREGIDLLGELIEASINSVNDQRYDFIGIHSQGHRNIGTLHDDIGESIGDDLVCAPIFNPSTAMRDPVFYLWHKLLDDLFFRHKYLLTPNHPTESEFPLLWPGVEVQSVFVQSTLSSQHNMLRTFFSNLTVDIPLTKDIFFSTTESYEYCIKRLDYDEFTYNIIINKQPFVTSTKAFVRIFLAPRFDFSGKVFTMEEQVEYFFPLDSFVVDVVESGQTVVTRTSSASSLLSHWKLETWMENTPYEPYPECGCGWPSHLLLPKGTVNGMAFDLFVMVTDASIDVPVEADPPGEDPVCKMGVLLCGIEDRKYPDVRPMGYPFDTKPFSILTLGGADRMVADLKEYISLIPNTNAIEVTITHAG